MIAALYRVRVRRVEVGVTLLDHEVCLARKRALRPGDIGARRYSQRGHGSESAQAREEFASVDGHVRLRAGKKSDVHTTLCWRPGWLVGSVLRPDHETDHDDVG